MLNNLISLIFYMMILILFIFNTKTIYTCIKNSTSITFLGEKYTKLDNNYKKLILISSILNTFTLIVVLIFYLYLDNLIVFQFNYIYLLVIAIIFSCFSIYTKVIIKDKKL